MIPLLEARSVSFFVGTKRLLEDVNLSFHSSQTVALIGPNGAGKSMLLRILSGDLQPRSGRVQLGGRRLSSYVPRTLALHRAVMSQQVNVAFPFTVAEVVRMGAGRHNDPNADALVGETLEELDLNDLACRDITTLSGGEQQRAHFARVLVQLAYGRQHGGSNVLLLDEPTASLDLRHQLGMLEAAKRRAQKGALIISIFHDLNLAALFAEYLVVLHRGRVYTSGSPQETLTDTMLKRVFGVETRVSEAPKMDLPFVLPQTMLAI